MHRRLTFTGVLSIHNHACTVVCLQPGVLSWQSCVIVACVVQDVIALVAYERPEEGPLHYLLALSQREQVADVVNRAVLSVAGASSSSSGSSCNGDAAGCISQAVPQVHCLSVTCPSLHY